MHLNISKWLKQTDLLREAENQSFCKRKEERTVPLWKLLPSEWRLLRRSFSSLLLLELHPLTPQPNVRVQILQANPEFRQRSKPMTAQLRGAEPWWTWTMKGPIALTGLTLIFPFDPSRSAPLLIKSKLQLNKKVSHISNKNKQIKAKVKKTF